MPCHCGWSDALGAPLVGAELRQRAFGPTRPIGVVTGSRSHRRTEAVAADRCRADHAPVNPVMGAMLEVLVQGTHDPELLAGLARGRLRAKLPELRGP